MKLNAHIIIFAVFNSA